MWWPDSAFFLALSVVVGVAVLREGSEVVLFLYGIAASGGTSVAAMLLGGFLGVLAGVGVSALMYFGLLTISRRSPFRRHLGPHHIACRGTGGASRCLRPTGRRCRSADDACLGHVVAAFRRQHRGAPAAHADRIYRPAFRSPADRLSGDDRNDHRADAPRREPQAGHRPGCELKRRPGPQFLQTCDSLSLTGCAPCR